jgi:hypothetical protein
MGMWWIIRYHMGSLTFGSLIVAIVGCKINLRDHRSQGKSLARRFKPCLKLRHMLLQVLHRFH